MSSRIDVDEIRSKTTNGNLTIQPNGTGLIVPKRTVAFQVGATDTDQSFTSGDGFTKVQWEFVELDTGSYWDATNHRYTPQVAGWYMFGGNVRFQVASNMKYASASVYKNGSREVMHQLQLANDEIGNGSIPIAAGLVQLNGSSDYAEVFVEFDHNTVIHDTANVKSNFFGMLVHAT